MMAKLFTRMLKLAAPCVAVCLSLPASGSIVQFDENVLPVNPENTATSFTHGDFSASGAVTVTASGIVLDVVDSDASNGVFGGLGVDFIQRDFDPATADLEIRMRVLGNNAADQINVVYRDEDVSGTTADEFQFQFFFAHLTPGDGFVTLTQNMLVPGPGFQQTAYGFSPGDGIQNPGLTQMQVQSAWGSAGRLNVEVDYIRIVPEPSTLLAGSLLGCVALIRRRA